MDLSAFTGVNRRLPNRFFSLRSPGAESAAAAIGVKLIRARVAQNRWLTGAAHPLRQCRIR